MSDAQEASAALRAKQKPLKDQYRSDPSSALVTLSSSGTLDPSAGLACSLATAGAAKKVAGLHKAAGGAGFDARGRIFLRSPATKMSAVHCHRASDLNLGWVDNRTGRHSLGISRHLPGTNKRDRFHWGACLAPKPRYRRRGHVP